MICETCGQDHPLGILAPGVMRIYRPLESGTVFTVTQIRQAQLDAIEECARAVEHHAGPRDAEVVAAAIRRLKDKV